MENKTKVIIMQILPKINQRWKICTDAMPPNPPWM